jgi:hypothetical protein
MVSVTWIDDRLAVLARPDDFRRRHQLADMSLRVFGGVKQQADDRRRKLRSTNRPWFPESRVVSVSKLLERTLNGRVERGHELVACRVTLIESILLLERGKLRR